MAVKTEVQVNLKADNANAVVAPAGDPILAPKAKESLDKAIQALREDNLSAAQKAIDDALKLAPGNPEALYVQGVVELKGHDWAKAQATLEKSVQIEPNQPRTLSSLGMALCNQKKFQEALAPLGKAVQLDPDSSWETQYSLGQAYYPLGRDANAVKAAQQAHSKSAVQARQADLLLTQSLVAIGQFEPASAVLRGTVKNHPGTPEAATVPKFISRLAADGKIKAQYGDWQSLAGAEGFES